jgi:ribulose-5-phosphate 4-epimerase/fuculose-1-phosphate aldolase
VGCDEQEIANMPKAKFKRIVKESVLGRAFSDLQRENSEKTRTQNIIHNKFEAQKYITHMHPTSAKIISSVGRKP